MTTKFEKFYDILEKWNTMQIECKQAMQQIYDLFEPQLRRKYEFVSTDERKARKLFMEMVEERLDVLEHKMKFLEGTWKP